MPTDNNNIRAERAAPAEATRTERTLTDLYAAEADDHFNYNAYSTKKTFSEKKASKPMKDPYSEIIQNEYLHMIADSEKYGVVIAPEIKSKLKNNIDYLNKIENDMKKLFEESSIKQEETKKALFEIKEEISEVLNTKKYEECILKAEEFIKIKNYNNAKACYENALYYTKSKRDEVSAKIAELRKFERIEQINKWVADIKYYTQAPNNTILNRVIEVCYAIDLNLLEGENITVFKTLYDILPNNKKVNLIGAILDNKTFSPKIKLGIL